MNKEQALMEISTAERFLDFLKFNLITGDQFPLQVDYDYVAKIKTSVDKLNLLLGQQPNSDVQPQLPQAPVSLSSPPSADVIEIFEWLLGYSDFPERRQGDGAFWWRKELRHRLEFLGIHIGGDAS